MHLRICAGALGQSPTGSTSYIDGSAPALRSERPPSCFDGPAPTLHQMVSRSKFSSSSASAPAGKRIVNRISDDGAAERTRTEVLVTCRRNRCAEINGPTRRGRNSDHAGQLVLMLNVLLPAEEERLVAAVIQLGNLYGTAQRQAVVVLRIAGRMCSFGLPA